MNILITGGTGVIGQALVKRWQTTHELIILSRSPDKVTALFGTAVKICSSINSLDFNQINAIINLAGEPIAGKRWSQRQKQQLCQSRWRITQQLVEKIKQSSNPPGVMISGSAVGVYGRQGSEAIDEHHDNYYPEFSHQLCQQWEALAQQASDTIRVCLLRTGIVLANNGGALKKMLPAFKLGLGGPISSGQQYMSWIHLDDMVRLIDFLLQHPTLAGAFNATAPEPVTNKEFSDALAKRLHRPALLTMPAPLLRLLMGEMADLLLYGQRVLPKRLLDAGFEFHHPKLTNALNALSL